MKSKQQSSEVKTPLACAIGDPIELVSGEHFFLHKVSLPASVGRSELSSFAALELEGNSPFPLDSLLWGYYFHEQGDVRELLIYAAYKERLQGLGLSNLHQFEYLLPSFFGAIGQVADEPSLLFYQQSNFLSLLYFPGNNQLPEFIHTLTLKNASTAVVEEAKSTLLGRITGVNPPETKSFIKASYPKKTTSQRCAIVLQDSAVNQTIFFSEDVLWEGDIRGPEFKRQEIKRRHVSRRLFKLLQGSIACGFLFLFMLLASAGIHLYTKGIEKDLVEGSSAAQEIESKDILLNRLEQFSAQQLKPFEMLAVVNMHRPDSIYFTITRAFGMTELEFDANASNVEEVNTYKTKLGKEPSIKNVLVENLVSSNGRVKFSMKISFNPES